MQLKSDFSINLNHLDIFLLIKLSTLLLMIYENEQQKKTPHTILWKYTFLINHQNSVLSEI